MQSVTAKLSDQQRTGSTWDYEWSNRRCSCGPRPPFHAAIASTVCITQSSPLNPLHVMSEVGLELRSSIAQCSSLKGARTQLPHPRQHPGAAPHSVCLRDPTFQDMAWSPSLGLSHVRLLQILLCIADSGINMFRRARPRLRLASECFPDFRCFVGVHRFSTGALSQVNG